MCTPNSLNFWESYFILTHFMPLVSFYTPLKLQKTFQGLLVAWLVIRFKAWSYKEKEECKEEKYKRWKILMTSGMQHIRIISRPTSRISKRVQFNQFRWKSSKTPSIKQRKTGRNGMISSNFKKKANGRPAFPTNPFL